MPDGPLRKDEIEEDDDWGAPPAADEAWTGPLRPPGPARRTPGAGAGRRGRAMAFVGGIAVVIVAAGILWWFRSPPAPEAPPPPVAVAEPEPVVEPPVPQLPALDESDPYLRALLSALTDQPDVLAWLLGDDLARRIAVAVDNVADGNSPRQALAGLSPVDPFRSDGAAEELRVHPETFARYDAIAEAAAAADSPAMARVIRDALPILETAYAELGRPDRSFAGALLLALDRMAAVPAPAAPLLLDEATMRYEYRDPSLEALDDASKHLLRFGPDNQAKVQEAARGFAERLRAGGAPF